MNTSQRLDTIITRIMNDKAIIYPNAANDAQWICNTLHQLISVEPSLLELSGPIHICGDIHGQLFDLLNIFEMAGDPATTRYLFLGDYVDRGTQSVEVILLLFALKLRHPSRIYLLRGNHESNDISSIHGFLDECKSKMNENIFISCCDIFDAMPLAAVVSGKYLCVHGGISPSLKKLSQIKQIRRPLTVHNKQLIIDLLWSDPNNEIEHWGTSDRGSTVSWGHLALQQFLTENNLKHIVRGHQVALEGIDYPFAPDDIAITVFSASNYCGEFPNRGAVLHIDEDGSYRSSQLPSISTRSQSQFSFRRMFGMKPKINKKMVKATATKMLK